MSHAYFLRAVWDEAASVWISETDIPGLVIEADTLAEFEALMEDLAPQMLAANTAERGRVRVDFSVQREFALA